MTPPARPPAGPRHEEVLQRLLRRQSVALLEEMRQRLGTSGRTVLRALGRLGYLTSYSHAGRYYTLRSIPTFDANGLWFFREIRFSAHGTLRATGVVLVRKAPAGHTHRELKAILGLRVHDTLRSLVEAKLLARQPVESLYVYLDQDPKRAAAQLERRRQERTPPGVAGPLPELDPARVIAVLVAMIRAPRDDSRSLATRLKAGGLDISEAQVQTVWRRYKLEKKTARWRSRRSRP